MLKKKEKKMKKPLVVGIGELLWDMLPGGKRAGGAPINFVYHASQMGAEGYAVSAVGKDDNGTEILAELERSRITGVIARNDYPTGTVEVRLQEGIPFYTIVENTAWDHIPFQAEAQALVQKADAVCFGTLALRQEDSRRTVLRLLRESNPKALKFFDVNLRHDYYSPELIRQMLEIADIFKLNDEELLRLREMFSLQGSDETVCREILRIYGLQYLIFTAGEKYSVVYTPETSSYLETPRVKVVDTVGAGDAFSGAFVYALLMGKPLREAHETATKTAAFVCTKAGAWPVYDGWAEVEAYFSGRGKA